MHPWKAAPCLVMPEAIIAMHPIKTFTVHSVDLVASAHHNTVDYNHNYRIIVATCSNDEGH